MWPHVLVNVFLYHFLLLYHYQYLCKWAKSRTFERCIVGLKVFQLKLMVYFSVNLVGRKPGQILRVQQIFHWVKDRLEVQDEIWPYKDEHSNVYLSDSLQFRAIWNINKNGWNMHMFSRMVFTRSRHWIEVLLAMLKGQVRVEGSFSERQSGLWKYLVLSAWNTQP